ncbi:MULTISPECIES: hypothetical protein [Methanosarcina]|uniref:GTPases-Sulfate adenylate transferase subunit 1 n=2 Tax=Methanosarcina barkeri TaxID=2208 RepID=A0A0G3CE73_METBA|nr:MULTISPECIES: hypothetical protein [Methanosarcina]AKJ37417.1 hypothetical protein MCM1_0304 [Methanosarcina barkeri CM1]
MLFSKLRLTKKQFGMGTLILAILLVVVGLLPAVSAEEEDNYSVTAEKAFEHANAHIIDFMSSDVPDFENWTDASIDPEPLELYDINGQKLFYEFSAYKNNTLVGKIYVGANKTLGPSVQVIETTTYLYNTTEALKKSIEVARSEYPNGEIKSTKVVEYSYPRIGAMTVVKDKTSGDEHRIFVDVYSLEVVPDRPVTETQLGVWSMYEHKVKNRVGGNLIEWEKSEKYTKSIEKDVANKGICISVPVILDNYSNYETSNVYYGYYHYFFGLNSYGNTVIARYGKLPVLKSDEQKENWNSTLEELGNNIKDTVTSKYMYPHGEVVTCGTNSKGYFVILFKYGNVSELLINELYSLIDNSAKQMGIQDIPVEFGYGIYREEIPLDSEQDIYHWFGDSTVNLSESDIHALEEYMKEKPTIPMDKTVVAYGKIPLLKDQNEIMTWADKLSAISGNTQDKITPYMEKGQVIVYGAELTRLDVGINETLPSEEKNTIVKEIYQIIDKEARKQNVTGVPVIFDEGIFIDEIATEDVRIYKEENNEELSNSNNSNSKSDNGNKSSEPSEIRSTPGFELLGSLTCLYGGWKFRKN